jgi:hypothetical protein
MADQRPERQVLHKQVRDIVLEFAVISCENQMLGSHCATLPKYDNTLPKLVLIQDLEL